MDFIQANYSKAQVKSIKASVLNTFNTYYESSSGVSTVNEDCTGVYAFYPKRSAKLARSSELLKFFKEDLQPPKTDVLKWWRVSDEVIQ